MNQAVSNNSSNVCGNKSRSSAISPIRESIPRLEEDLISRLNILHERGIYAKTQVNDSNAHWRLEYTSDLTKNWIKLAPGIANGSNQNTEIWIALDQFYWSTLVNDRHWQSFDESNLSLAFSIAHSDFLTHLQSMTDSPLQVIKTDGKLQHTPSNLACYTFSVEHNQKISTGAIAFSEQALASLTARNIWNRAILPRHEFMASLSVPLTIEMPILPMGLGTLSQFTAGDLLLCGERQTLSSQIQLISTRSRRPLWRLEEKEAYYQVVGPPLSLEARATQLSPMSELTSDNQHMEAPVMQKETTNSTDTINDLPVDLSIEIGSLNMTVGELDNIEPGHVLKLPPEIPSKQARLIANGLAIGRGEIVMVGDQLAIRLTELAK